MLSKRRLCDRYENISLESKLTDLKKNDLKETTKWEKLDNVLVNWKQNGLNTLSYKVLKLSSTTTNVADKKHTIYHTIVELEPPVQETYIQRKHDNSNKHVAKYNIKFV